MLRGEDQSAPTPQDAATPRQLDATTVYVQLFAGGGEDALKDDAVITAAVATESGYFERAGQRIQHLAPDGNQMG